jgi:hypothetical protein
LAAGGLGVLGPGAMFPGLTAGGGIPASATASLTATGGALPAWSPKTSGQYASAAHQYLISKGYSPEEAATIMGNLQQESQFNPRAYNPNDAGPGQNSGGIYQANRNRVADENAFISKDTGRTVDLAHRNYGGLSDSQLFYSELGSLD